MGKAQRAHRSPDQDMTAYRRIYQPGACYFFTLVTEQRRPLLVDNIDRLRRAFRMGMNRRPFRMHAVVVLPDHLHALWWLPDGDHDFSTRWMHIKRCFSAGLDALDTSASKRRKREKGIWQRRFWEHLIRDETDWRRHMDYIHYNPVKHGLCSAPINWEYGSFRRCVGENPYTPDRGREMPSDLHDLDWE